MQINPINNAGPVQRPVANPPSAPSVKTERDEANFAQVAALNTAMDESPTARASEIERAKDLIGDVTYPPRETIARISNLLALRMSSNQD